MPEGAHTPVSMVVPVYNEVDNVRPLVEAIAAAMGETPYEIVLVNDGSTDGSDAVLNAMAAEDLDNQGRSLRPQLWTDRSTYRWDPAREVTNHRDLRCRPSERPCRHPSHADQAR